MKKTYRKLLNEEITQLEQENCRCECWDDIQVAINFTPEHIRNVNFSGQVRLGVFEKQFTLFGGVQRHSGISNATIHNCIIGDNVYIGQVRNYIANYIIEDDVLIDSVDILAVDGISTFGNNTFVKPLSETGGREVPIFDYLSAQLAYILMLYRHKQKAIKKILSLINDYTLSIKSEYGHIGKGSQLISCRNIKNVRIGDYSLISGVYRLYNGTINSNIHAPSVVGSGVVAEDFIISTGAKVDDGTVVFKCFVGQGCELAKQYSAENSLFFANTLGYHGEASSIFAGPFTSTHHKSTLLIAGMFSFMNAGSGSNQSNHMYKLGPIHQGVMERGAKTSSDSYILWPAKIGCFTMVMGRHFKHPDTSDIPFSYLIESNDESILVPAANLRSVGTIRDAQKWPKRDKRKDPNCLDCINYNLLSPYTIDKMMKAIHILRSLQHIIGHTSEIYTYHNTIIRNSSLNKGIELYEMGITKFLGNSIISRIENSDIKTNKDLRDRLKPSTTIGKGVWVDIAGMIAPKSEVNKLLEDIENGSIKTIHNIAERFKYMHNMYYEYEWTWVYSKLNFFTEKPVNELTANDVIGIVKHWKTAVVDLDNKLYKDAEKEFTLDYKIGFGMDGNENERNIDFEEVRGKFTDNWFVTEVLDHIKRKSALADKIIYKLETIQ